MLYFAIYAIVQCNIVIMYITMNSCMKDKLKLCNYMSYCLLPNHKNNNSVNSCCPC